MSKQKREQKLDKYIVRLVREYCELAEIGDIFGFWVKDKHYTVVRDDDND